MKRIAPVVLLLAGTVLAGPACAASFFIPGNLVISVEGNGSSTGSYTDNQAAPLTLYQYRPNGTGAAASFVNSLELPQAFSGANNPISGEYGSSSEGNLQLTGNGRALVIAGYGVNANTYNAAVAASLTDGTDPFGNRTTDPTKLTALGQSASIACGLGCTPVPRVIAVIGSNGAVNTTTALTGVFNGNNPRSVASADGKTFYISGQGNNPAAGPDQTGGVFFATLGAQSATPITGLDTNESKTDSSLAAQDTRIVHMVDGRLVVSVDSKEGNGDNRDFVGTIGGGLPTNVATGGAPSMLLGFGNSGGTGKVTLLTLGDTNGINAVNEEINLSPEDFFFANATTLYVADSGAPKNDSVTNDKAGKGKPTPSTLGDGGLQKWSLSGGVWTLDYTLADGLDLVANSSGFGTTGLLGLTGEVVGGNVELFATNFTVGDTDPTFLFGISDVLADTTNPEDERFTVLATAPSDTNFKGVSFAPVPEPATYALLTAGFGLVGGVLRRRRPQSALA